MDNQLKKKYGLITAIAMVVGTVIGSGVFFKAGKVLTNNNGNMAKSLLTVAIVGLIMLICSYVFSILAQRYEKVNGLVDYSEAACGPRYAYYVGWFVSTIYYPTLTSTLAWISAQYTCTLFGWSAATDIHLAIAAFYLIAGYSLNALSPKLAGKFQVSATFIKLIPLLLMAVIGTVVGLINGTTLDAMTANIPVIGADGAPVNGNILTAVVAFAFAYEGWIITTSINAELKNSKKNLPIALVLGAVIVVAVYMLYFLGLTGALTAEELMASGDVPKDAFGALFGNPIFGTIAYVFIIISCLGTMNGLMLGCCRGLYSIAIRGQGPAPKVFAQVDKETNMPTNSSIFGLLMCGLWLAQWQLGIGQAILGTDFFNSLVSAGNPDAIFGYLPKYIGWENDELPIITLYAAYIPIFIVMMVKFKELNIVKRFVFPALAIIACVFMVYAAISAYKIQALYYLIVFAVVMIIGIPFYRKNAVSAESKSEEE
ncbi:MAG: amino acid permease [Ruminococcaceae bacterium]|nr:amino acid permease [Oscillospiraceae bacterium]